MYIYMIMHILYVYIYYIHISTLFHQTNCYNQNGDRPWGKGGGGFCFPSAQMFVPRGINMRQYKQQIFAVRYVEGGFGRLSDVTLLRLLFGWQENLNLKLFIACFSLLLSSASQMTGIITVQQLRVWNLTLKSIMTKLLQSQIDLYTTFSRKPNGFLKWSDPHFTAGFNNIKRSIDWMVHLGVPP